MNKKILSAILALTLCMGMTACSESENTETTASKASETVTEAPDRSVEPNAVNDEDTTPDETTTEEETVTDEETQSEGEHKLHELKNYQNFVALDDKDGFYFEVQLTPEEAASGIKVELLDDNGEVVAEMLDNGGSAPDRIAGDGLYSCFFKPESDVAETYNMTARYGDTTTNTVRVRLYDELDDEDFDKLREVTAEFDAITDKYKDVSGAVPADKFDAAMDEAEALAEKLYDEEEIIEYNVTRQTNTVTIWLKSCLPFVYTIEPFGVD